MMKPRGLRVAGGSAGCAQGRLLTGGSPRSWERRRCGRDPQPPVSGIHLGWKKAWALIGQCRAGGAFGRRKRKCHIGWSCVLR